MCQFFGDEISFFRRAPLVPWDFSSKLGRCTPQGGRRPVGDSAIRWIAPTIGQRHFFGLWVRFSRRECAKCRRATPLSSGFSTTRTDRTTAWTPQAFAQQTGEPPYYLRSRRPLIETAPADRSRQQIGSIPLTAPRTPGSKAGAHLQTRGLRCIAPRAFAHPNCMARRSKRVLGRLCGNDSPPPLQPKNRCLRTFINFPQYFMQFASTRTTT